MLAVVLRALPLVLLATCDALRPRIPPSVRPRSGLATMITPPIESSPLNSRLAVAILAGAGAIETGAISYNKLVGDGDGLQALCFAGGSCSDVLNGPWADVFGIPLAAFGAPAYTSAGALAVAPMLQPSPAEATADSKNANTALLGLTAAMASFSACLMLLLAVEIQLPCSLCIGSALLSTAMFGAAWRSSIAGLEPRPH